MHLPHIRIHFREHMSASWTRRRLDLLLYGHWRDSIRLQVLISVHLNSPCFFFLLFFSFSFFAILKPASAKGVNSTSSWTTSTLADTCGSGRRDGNESTTARAVSSHNCDRIFRAFGPSYLPPTCLISAKILVLCLSHLPHMEWSAVWGTGCRMAVEGRCRMHGCV